MLRALVVVGAILLATGAAQAAEPSQPQVRLAAGSVRGQVIDGVSVFRAIPYAQPPIGPLRFRPPQPAKAWSGVLDALDDGPACPQNKSLDPAGKPSTNEDCLRLNVFAPAAPSKGARPVMVWIHGGGFNIGFGGASQYNPSALVKESGIVAVSINYRLGTLGLLATQSLTAGGELSGNYGIRDQIAALRWVRANIAKFGGDPNNVTIAGESAGAQSVFALVVSPLAKGLFHKAIVQSPPANSHVYARARLEQDGAKLAEKLGCPRNAQQAACLRQMPVEKILTIRGELGMVEDAALFPIDTFEAFRRGAYNRVPMIIGSNLHEGYFSASGVERRLNRPMTEADYLEQLKTTYGAEADNVAKIYSVAEFPSPAAAVGEAYGDVNFACYTEMARVDASAFSPVFGYEMNEPDPVQQQPRPPISLANTSYHTSDLAYLFNVDAKGPLTGDAAKLGKTMRAAWVQFMKTGAPNGDGLPTWPQFHGAGSQVLNLSNAGGTTKYFWSRHRCPALTEAGVVYVGVK